MPVSVPSSRPRRADLQGPGPDSRWNSPHWALKEGGLAHPSPRTPPTLSRLPLVPLDRDGANLVAIRGSVSIFRIFGHRLSMAHADRMGSTRKDVAASRYLEIKGSSARRSSNLDDAVSPRLPRHPLRPNSQSGGLVPWYSSYRNTCMASPQAKSSNMPRQAIGPAVCEEVVS